MRSRRLTPVTTVSTVGSLLLTVPAGRTAVVRTITIINRHATVAVALRLGIGSTAAAARIYQTAALPPGGTLALDHWLALDPLDQLWAALAPAQANSLNVTLFGALLEGAPE